MDDLTMFIKHSGNGGPLEYAFGPDWVGMALYMDDVGAESEEIAVLEWYHKIFKYRKDGSYYVPTKRDADVEEWMSMNKGDESEAILKWYREEYKKGMFTDAKS